MRGGDRLTQRYLATLADAGKVRLSLRYGGAGRPEHRYELDGAMT